MGLCSRILTDSDRVKQKVTVLSSLPLWGRDKMEQLRMRSRTGWQETDANSTEQWSDLVESLLTLLNNSTQTGMRVKISTMLHVSLPYSIIFQQSPLQRAIWRYLLATGVCSIVQSPRLTSTPCWPNSVTCTAIEWRDVSLFLDRTVLVLLNETYAHSDNLHSNKYTRNILSIVFTRARHWTLSWATSNQFSELPSLQVLRTNPCISFSFPPCVLHGPPILSSFIS